MEDYIANASRTLSPSWHGDKVSLQMLKGRINGAIDALNKLDQVKKSLFYGRDNNLISDGETSAFSVPDSMTFDDNQGGVINIIHAIIGKATEAGELLEALRDCYNGKPLDRINVLEEVGDGFWYDAILLKELKSTFSEVQQVNINKLRARFPEKFNSVNANERDLDNERTILADGYSTNETKLDIVPTKPVGGASEVLKADIASRSAFDKVQNVEGRFIEQTTDDLSNELHLSPAARSRAFPDEHLSRQPVDPRKK